MSIKPAFQGELQFRRYSDTSTQGQQIVFSVADREALAPFIGKEGRRYMAVLVELGDDEMPVQQPERSKPGPLCVEACQYCIESAFWEWVSQTGTHCDCEADAKAYVLERCLVGSRRELDMKPGAADAFRSLIRVPFLRWQRDQRIAMGRRKAA